MPGVRALSHEARQARGHLYEMAYWALALFVASGSVNGDLGSSDLRGLLLIAAGLCAAICVYLSAKIPDSGAVVTGLQRSQPVAALAAPEQALKVELERTRRKAGPFAVILLQMNHDTAAISQKEARSIISSAAELLHRYLQVDCTVLRMQGDRIAAIMPGASAFEVERLLDRLQEDVRGWTRSSPGVDFSAGVVADRTGSAPVENIMRDLNLAVRRAGVYGRGRFVITER